MTEHKSVSLADRVFERLEDDILSGRYAYGETLTEARLSEELGVSRTPVREAVRRLEQEHLLRESGKGLVVQGITKEDVADILDIRLRIEGMAVRLAAARMSDEEKKRLLEAVELQEFYVAKGDAAHIQEQDHQFHERLYAGCGSLTLQSVLVPLHRKAQMFRRAAVERAARAGESVREHRKIAEALLAGDADKAEQLMLEHIEKARENMIGNVGKETQ